jgi:hypothetical protein
MNRLFPGVAIMAMVLCGFASRASAVANYVYHDAATADIGGTCGTYRDNLAPGPGDAVTVRFKVEYQGSTNRVRLYYTTDGSAPSGAYGVASGATTAVTAAYVCTFTYGQVIDVAEAVIPAQPAGTTVKYIVSAWMDLQGDEIFANSGTCSGCNPATTSSGATVFSYQVSQPSAVDLLDFEAVRTDAGVQLTWQTGAEVDCGAFTLLRCELATGDCLTAADYAELAGIEVPCQGNATGASYSSVDATAAAGGAYSYYLHEHETTGGTRDYGPVTAPPADAAITDAPTAPAAAGAGGGTSGCAASGRPASATLLLALCGLAAAFAARPRRR